MRYRRRQETKNAQEYIHGGKEGALLGAWDFLTANVSEKMMNTFIGKYKRGKYIEGVISQAIKNPLHKQFSLNIRISCHAGSCVLCKTQSSVFDASNEAWVPRNVKCLDIDMQLSLNRISNESVEKYNCMSKP